MDTRFSLLSRSRQDIQFHNFPNTVDQQPDVPAGDLSRNKAGAFGSQINRSPLELLKPPKAFRWRSICQCRRAPSETGARFSPKWNPT
jgi:hypothetical protein